MAKKRAARAGMTRRAVLVVGGVTLLAGYSAGPAGRATDAAQTNIMRNTRTGSIILEHDGGGNRSQTVAALTIVLPRLLAAGYHFATP